MTEQNGAPDTGAPAPEDDELTEVPEHHNDLGDWCPSSGGKTSDGTCPQYCRHADELVGFDAGERDGDEDEDDPAEVSEEHEDAGAVAVRRCAYCGHLGDLEPINPHTSSQACRNTVLCQLRQQSQDPPMHLADVALAVAKDVTRLSEIELARVILALKRAVVAAEVELGNNRDRARGDAALAQAAGEMAPRKAGGPPTVCRECGSPGDCTYPCSPELR